MKRLVKRTLAGLVALCLMLGFLPVRPAKALSYGDLEYGFCGPAGSEIFIMPCNPSVTGTVVIPEHINGLPVTMIEGYAFRDCIGMTELIVPETVVTIHENAFIGCDNLNYNHYDNGTYLGNANNPYQVLISVSNEQSTYTIHSDTTGVADCAFQGTEVTSVILPEGVTEVPNRAFMDCTQLTTVGLSSNLSTVESSAFKNCTALTSVNLSRATYLGSSAFENCSSLTDVRMYWLEYLGSAAFKNCTSLTSAYISGKVSNINNETFYNCSSLSTVTISSGVTAIGESAFRRCSSLTSVVIPDSVTSIGKYAFFYCENLTSVVLPSGIASIQDYTFEGCGKLANINIPKGVTYIGYYAFYQCYNLAQIYIPASVKTIDSHAFGSYTACSTSFTVATDNPFYSSDDYGVLFNRDQTRMLHVPRSIEGVYVVPQTVTEIPDYAFRNCTGLTGVTIPDNVTQIGDNAFSLCEKLTAITLPDSVISIGDYVFYDCDNLTDIKMSGNVTNIGDYAFYSCDNLAAITIPASVTGMGKYVFYNCPVLKSVAFLGSAPAIGSNLFRYTNLTICYPEEDPSWTEEVKQSCGASLIWRPHVCTYTSNGDVTCTQDGTMSGVCEYCGNTITRTDPTPGHQFVDNVCTVCGLEVGADDCLSYSIENDAVTITGCDTALTGTLEIPGIVGGYPVTHITVQAFADCTCLTEIIIPGSVTAIDTGAFLSCTGLKKITVAPENPAYSSDAYGVLFNKDQTVLIQAPAAITDVYPVPAGVNTIEANAFSGCIGLTTVSFPEAAPAIGENAFANVTANVCYIEDKWTANAHRNYGGTLTWQPHSGSFTSNGDATCAEPGTMTGVCDHCGVTVTVTEPALGHQYVDNICSVCGERSRNYSGTYKTPTLTLNYEVVDGKVTITGGGTSDGDMVIPDTIDGYSVTQIDGHAFSCCTNLTSVIIPNSVTTIGSNAFYYCTGLTTVVIPEGVTRIESYAFYDCSRLTKAMIAGSVNYIGEFAFASCGLSRGVYFWGDAPTFSYRPFHDIPVDYIDPDIKIYYRSDAKGWTDSLKENCDINLTWIEYNVIDNLIYKIIDAGAWDDGPSYAIITGWVGTPTELSLPEKIQYATVTEITSDAFKGCYSLTSVTVPDNVTTVERGAFSDCINLTDVHIGSGVNELSTSAFSGSDSLTGIWVDEKNAVYSSDASGVLFNKDKTTLMRAPNGIVGAHTIPEGVITIQDGAFSGCSSLTDVTVPASVVNIGSNAFADCNQLNYNQYDNGNYLGNAQNPYQAIISISDDQSIYVIHPDTTAMADSAFRGTKVCSVTIPNGVTVIPGSAFYGCSKLTDVSLSNRVTSIGANAFYKCSSLTSIIVPESVNNIGSYAFERCSSLTSITFLGSAPSIGSYAFRNVTANAYHSCTDTTWTEAVEQNYGGAITWIGHLLGNFVNHQDATCTQNAIKMGRCSQCGAEETVSVPKTATGHSYGDYVYNEDATCTQNGTKTRQCQKCGVEQTTTAYNTATGHSYETVTTPPTCTEEGFTTYTCACGDSYTADTVAATGHSYEAVTTPPTCTEEGFTAHTCVCGDSYQTDTVPATGHQFENNVCSYCGLEVPSYTTTQGVLTFQIGNGVAVVTDCDTAASGNVELPDNVDGYPVIKIGENAFLDCNKLAEVTLPDSITEIEKWAFAYCSSLADISIPNSVIRIGEYAFYRCNNLISVVIPEGVATIEFDTFADCTALTSVTIPSSVTSIGDVAFSGCTRLEDVVIPDSVTDIGNSAFNNCISLSSVTIPASVTNIGSSAFEHCTGLKSFTVSQDNPSYSSDDHGVLFNKDKTVLIKALVLFDGEYAIPEGVTEISGYSFHNVTGITGLTVPESVTIIGYFAFFGSSDIKTITFTGSAPTVSGYAFERVTADVYYPVHDTSWTEEVQQSFTGTMNWIGVHTYENGACTVCGQADPDYVKPIVRPTLTLKYPSLEFQDMVRINAFFTAENTEDVVEMGMITYSSNVETWCVENAEHVIPGADYLVSSGQYIATSQGIHAKYLGDTVYLAVYAKLTDGTYVYSKLAPYSAVQYATNQLKNSTDMKLKQLVVSMLKYGAEVQLFFKHNTESLANASLTADQAALAEAYRADMIQSIPAAPTERQGIFKNNQGYSSRKPAVSFESAFGINYFFTPKYAPVDGITLYYWTESDYNAADVLTAENATGSMKMKGSGTEQYSGSIDGISAKDLSQAVYVAAVYSDGTTTWTSGVLGYSIGAYCSHQVSKGSDIAVLAKASAVYGYHAKQYFG